MHYLKYLFVFILFIFNSINAGANDSLNTNNELIIKKGLSTRIIPIVYYLPETSFGFGAAGIATFRFSKEQKRASVFQFAGFYTLKNQFNLTSSFDFFAKGEDLRFIGELSYYDYFYNFYGIGKQTQKNDFERYQASFPRLRIATYRKLKSDFSAGLLYQFEGITSIQYEKGGIIDNSDFVGKEGGLVSNLGFGMLYDNRDNIISPMKGFFAEFQYIHSNKIFFSAFNYHDSSIDLRYFTTPVNKVTIGSNFFLGHMNGDVPFYDMYSIGSSARSRGVTDRRFKDKTTMVGQIEVRFPIFARFRANIFASTASVGNGLSSTLKNQFTKSYGVGIRYIVNKNDRSVLRFDAARSREGFNFYFTAGEAF